MKKNNKSNLYVCIFSVIIITAAMLFFSLISPFQLWDLNMRIVDDDKILVLRTFWILAIITNLLFCMYSRTRKFFTIVFAIFLILSTLKTTTLFTI